MEDFDQLIEGASIWLFKNGFGVVERMLALPQEAKSNELIQLQNPPAFPVHGTFWVFGSAALVQVNSIQTQSQPREIDQPCLTVRDLLVANVGKNLDIFAEEGKEFNWISGSLIEIPKPEIKDTLSLDASRDVIILQNDEGICAIPIHNIQRIRLPATELSSGKKLDTKIKKSVFENVLSINYSKKEGSGYLRIRYLTNNITWAPSYHLKLSQTEKAEKTCIFSLKAVVLNDAESLNAKNVSLITGFPNMQFKSVVDPLAKDKQSVSQFLASLGNVRDDDLSPPAIAQQRRSSNVMMQSLTSNSYQPAYSAPDSNNNNGPSTSNDDLYVYTINDILLSKKERIYIPIFTLELPFTDVYHCEIVDNYSGSSEFQDVWHAVRIKNSTQNPWTTAPVTVDRGENFVGQDTNNYTAAGDESLINLTKAYAIKIMSDEKSEASRSKITIFNLTYSTYTVKGQINITNLKSEEVLVQIKRSIVGDLKSSTPNFKSNIEKPRYDIANAHRTVTWEVKVGAGKSFVIDYLYHVNRR